METLEPYAGWISQLLDNPEDKGLPLVFADYLEERGDPWGELIRLEIEEVDHPNPNLCECHLRWSDKTYRKCPNCFRKVRRAEILLGNAIRLSWPIEPLISLEDIVWSFQGGFRRAVTCTVAEWIFRSGPVWKKGEPREDRKWLSWHPIKTVRFFNLVNLEGCISGLRPYGTALTGSQSLWSAELEPVSIRDLFPEVDYPANLSLSTITKRYLERNWPGIEFLYVEFAVDLHRRVTKGQ